MGECRSCGAPIRFGITEKGRKMPLDANPAPDGKFHLVKARIGDGFDIVAVGSDLYKDEPRYHSHFATCPHAGQHRRAKR